MNSDISGFYTILYSATIVGILVVASLVTLRKKGSGYTDFAIFAILLDIWLGLQFMAQVISGDVISNPNLILRAAVALSPFFAVFFFFFTRHYVGRKVHRTIHLIAPALLGIVGIMTDLTIKQSTATSTGLAIQEYGSLYFPTLFIVVGYALVSVGLIINELRPRNKGVSASKRQASKILILGVFQAIVVATAVVTVFSEEPLSQIFIPLSLLLMIIVFAYAIVRHQLFDIRLVVVRALAYLLSVATIAIIYSILTLSFTMFLFQNNSISLSQQIYFVAIALFLAVTFYPLKKYFDKVTRAIFYRDAYETQDVIDKIGSVLVKTTDIQALNYDSITILKQAMKSQYIAVIFAENKIKSGIISIGETIPNQKSLHSELVNSRASLLVQDEMTAEMGGLAKVLRNADCALAVKLETHNDFVGYLVFGQKGNGSPYTGQDINLARIVADELTLAIQNALRFEEIRQFNITLQAKVDRATNHLQETNAKLKLLDKAKDDFISMASHQLRTPLTAVKGYVSMVLEGDVGKVTGEQRKVLEQAYESSQRMVFLIGDFLNVSRLQTGKFELEMGSVDLAGLVQEEVEQLSDTANNKKIQLVYHKPARLPMLRADENKLRQVIMNFIDNAIYYSKPNSKIAVHVLRRAGELVFEVTDIGIGVPKDEQAQLFTKFFRASNAKRQRPDGTGIGLYMAKKVIVAHGGSIIFESTEGKGSTFGFHLPLRTHPQSPDSA